MKRVLSLLLMALSLTAQVSFAEDVDCKKAQEYFKKAYDLDYSMSALIQKEQFYKKALELCPEYSVAHNNLGDVYEKQGRMEEAIAEYNKAIELKPDAAYGYFGLGDIYYKSSRYREAIEAYKRGLKYDPDDALTKERMDLSEEIIRQGSVIKGKTIRGMLSITRGAGEIVSVTFKEDMIPFDFNESVIRADAKPQLNEVGNALSDLLTYGDAKMEIVGYTDIRGTDEYNLDLSNKRASSVINYLSENFKIPKSKLIAKGYGERKNLCTLGASETDNTPCNALNRRVEIARMSGTVRGIGGTVGIKIANEPKITVDTGFFYQRDGEGMVNILSEDNSLRSRSDKYFIFFRPIQDCYVYLIQEDSAGNVNLLFPEKGSGAYVKAEHDYWVPGFGKGHRLDDVTGMENIYLVASLQSIESEIEGLPLKEQVKSAVRSLKTRIIKVVQPSDAQAFSFEELKNRPQKVNDFIEKIEGEGGWVKVVRFRHE